MLVRYKKSSGTTLAVAGRNADDTARITHQADKLNQQSHFDSRVSEFCERAGHDGWFSQSFIDYVEGSR
jgi:hypothetical protein